MDQRKKEQQINDLYKNIKNKEDAVIRRLERLKRQEDIKEAAASDNTDQTEVKQRESFLIQKLWNGFLKRKMEREMQKATGIEEAFQKIRTSTVREENKRIGNSGRSGNCEEVPHQRADIFSATLYHCRGREEDRHFER